MHANFLNSSSWLFGYINWFYKLFTIYIFRVPNAPKYKHQ